MNAFENPEFAASDARLLRKWVEDRDAEAFREIVTRHVNMVFATCRRVSGNAADAEDAVQECFLRLAASDVPGRTSLAGWLHRVATRITLSRLRSDRRRMKREERYVRESFSQDEALWTDIQRHVDEAIEELSEKVRYVVVRHFLEGESQVEIARALGISAAAVSSRLGSGVERIRKHLKSRGFSVPIAALSAMLRTRGVEAAPPALSVALAKVALSGIMMPASGGGSLSTTVISVGALLTMKKVIIVSGMAILGFISLQIVRWSTGDEDPRASMVQLDADPAAGRDSQGGEALLTESPPIRISAVAEKPALSVQLVDGEDQSVQRGRVQIRWGQWGEEIDPQESAARRFAAQMGWERLERE